MRHIGHRPLVLLAAGLLAVGCTPHLGGPRATFSTPAASPTTEPTASWAAGEIRDRPHACHLVPAAEVRRIVPSAKRYPEQFSAVGGVTMTRCEWTWSTGHGRASRLLQVTVHRYGPEDVRTGTRRAVEAYGALGAPGDAPVPGIRTQARIHQESTGAATVSAQYRNIVIEVLLALADKNGEHPWAPEKAHATTVARDAVDRLG